ncbi:MAG: RagB/SusD family nutrient uptake outer membrane protein [Phocaeicola sp.]
MKKLVTYIATALLTLGASSCSDFLDKEYDLSMSEDQVFSSFENTRGFLANIYTNLPDGFKGYTDPQFRAASRDCMSDNAISFWDVHYYHSVLTDSYSALNHPFALDFWDVNLKGIRKTNIFLLNARESVIGNSEKVGDDHRLYDRSMAEARFLRAIFHFDLSCWFGDIPVIGDDETGTPIIFDLGNPESMNMKRTHSADALKWIADQCDLVKDVLPFRYSNEAENWGRMNGAAAYALKSRALLYRASALHNPSNDASYWRDAADAAEDFIRKNENLGRPFELYSTGNPDTDYYTGFVITPYLNKEFILTRSVWNTRAIEEFLAPHGFSGALTAVGRTNPTQNLVDAYETREGLPIDAPTANYNPAKPFENRDPRLSQTILHHGSVWGDALNEEEVSLDVTSPSGANYQGLHGGTLTGYYTKKFLNNISFKNPTNSDHAFPYMRYGEILLNAAEAINEAEGNPANAYKYVNQVRARAGMPPYSGMNQIEFRERIRNERRVELCFEDHRFLDERRWKLFEGANASSEKNLPRYKQVYNLYGVTVTDVDNPTYTYGATQKHPTRVFNSPKNYFLPIPDSDVKRAPNLGQNAGWDLTE